MTKSFSVTKFSKVICSSLILCATSFSMSSVLTMSGSALITPNYLKGDLNGDNAISLIDVANLNSYLTGESSADSFACNISNADLNSDTKVNTLDAFLLKQSILSPANETTTVTLTGESIEVDGAGATADNSTLTITQKGTYVISGELNNGAIIIDSLEDVNIILNGADINSQTGCPLYALNGDMTITLAEGTDNTISDTDIYSDSSSSMTAGIYSKDRITINGDGSLTVNGKNKYGIYGSDEVKIKGGNVTVEAFDDALRANDYIEIENCIVDIDAEDGDGIKASDGYIAISQSATIKIKADNDCIQAGTEISIDNSWATMSGKRGLTSATKNIIESSVFVSSKEKMESASITSSNNSVYLNYALADIASDTKILFESGENSLDFKTNKKFQYIYMTSPDIVDGSSYKLTNNGNSCVYEGSATGDFLINSNICEFNDISVIQ